MDGWPYPKISDMYTAGDSSWTEINESVYWYLLECLPPAAWKENAFMVGEPFTHDQHGAIHSAVVVVNDRYFIREAPIKDFYPGTYTSEIIKQFGLNGKE